MPLERLFRRATRPFGYAAALALTACGNHAETQAQRADSTGSPSRPKGPFGGATITGVVRFVGVPPENPVIDMRAAPACRAVYHAVPRQLAVVVNPNQTLSDVYVYVKRGLPAGSAYAPPADTLLLIQRGCQYHPRVFGAVVGQIVEFRNDDIVSHQIDATGVRSQPFTATLGAGRTSEHVFRRPEIMVPLECSTHAWMRAYVGVLAHPFFATTGSNGRFTISRLPPGTYTLEAWHEGYGRRTATVTVRDSATQHVTFTYAATPSEISD